MNREEAQDYISQLIISAESQIEEAKKVADEHSLYFTFSMGEADNVDRSVGGEYFGKGAEHDGYTDDYGDHVSGDENENGVFIAWQASSEEC